MRREKASIKYACTPQTKHYDVVIVGSGGAGLSLALSLPSHLRIAMIAKDKLTEASTFYAQGGVAAVLTPKERIMLSS